MTDCDSDMLMFYNVFFFFFCLHPDGAGGERGVYSIRVTVT